MAAEPPSHLRFLWVPILMALIAAAIVTLRGCGASPGGRPEESARETGRR